MPVRTDTRQVKVTITETYTFDPEAVNTWFARLGMGGTFADYDDDARAQEVFERLYDSVLFNEIFWGGNGPDTGYEYDRFDPEA